MISYLVQFSDSFVLVLLLWPFLAAFLTLPILLLQYFKYRRLVISKTILTYSFILYLLALVAFTLYPLPSDAVAFCAKYQLSPQLNILQFIKDIQFGGLRAFFQIAMNFVFFVPLGIFARNYLGLRFRSLVVVAFLTSLMLECAQLTGVFGLYPCSYRLFDVCDLVINTLGAISGFCLAIVLPKFTNVEKGLEITTKPGLIRRSVILIIDTLFIYILIFLCLALIYLFMGNSVATEFKPFIVLIIFIAYQLILPLFWQGKTPASHIAHTSLDDKKRHWLWRFLFYLSRAVLLALFIVVDFHFWFQPVLFILVCAYWKKTKTPLYALVDELFTKKKSKKDRTKE